MAPPMSPLPPPSSSVLRTLLLTGTILFLSFLFVFHNVGDLHNQGMEIALQQYANGAHKVMRETQAGGFFEFRQRDLLRVFEERGTQGMPFIPTPPPQATQSSTTTTPTPLEYFTPMIIIAGIGAGIGIITCMIACVIWWCRCCCKRCCMGTTDPERHYGVLRLFILSLGFLVMAGAFLGLYGGRDVSYSLRSSLDAVLLSLTNYGQALATLEAVANAYNFDLGEFPAIRDTLANFATIVGLAQQFFTPVDGARLAILYSAMTVGMLAAIGLGLGACLRRKEVLTVSFVSAVLAILIGWFSFAINYPMAVTLDDSCVTLREVLANSQIELGGQAFLIGCLPASLFVELDDAVRSGGYFYADELADDEASANADNPSNFDPITVNRTLLNATYPSMIDFNVEIKRQLNATLLAEQAFPCASACTSTANITDWSRNLAGFTNMSLAAGALVELQNCSNVQRVLDAIDGEICQRLVVGVLLVFVGSIVIGTLLIPMAVMGLYVSQKFPERSPAARVKSRILVIYVFLFFHALVGVLSELHTWWVELATCIATCVGGIIGFVLINLPMNKWDWQISSQVLLSLALAAYFCVTLAGWIYLFYFAVLNNISCGQQAAELASTILNLPNPSTLPGPLQDLVPICSQSEYAHSIVVAIFAGTGSIMTAFAALLAIVLAGKIACGTPLRLDISDYELD